MASATENPQENEEVNSRVKEEECENDNSSGEEAETADKKEATAEDGTKLSKNQLKKLKKQENALKFRAEKRLKERENKKRRKRERRENGEDVGPNKKQLKKNTMANSACKIRVAIDCDFDDLMSEKDIMKLTSQIGYAYSANRRADNPLQYYVTSLGGQTKTRMDKIGDYPNWDVNFTEKSYTEEFDKDSIVYLSSDSDNVLTTLDIDKVYIIGGLVDHNHHKGLCHRLAVEKGINHAQLPIGKFIEMNSRSVLTINHVFEILLKFTKTNSWEEAFFEVLPKRKGATTRHSEHQNVTSIDAENTTADEKSVENSADVKHTVTEETKKDDSADIKHTVTEETQKDEGKSEDNVTIESKSDKTSELDAHQAEVKNIKTEIFQTVVPPENKI